MFYIGCHLSSAKGYMAMGKEAVELGCNVFQFFTRNPRGGSVKPLDLEDLQKYNAFHKEKGFGTLLAHAPYTMNPCAAKEDLRPWMQAPLPLLNDLLSCEIPYCTPAGKPTMVPISLHELARKFQAQ